MRSIGIVALLALPLGLAGCVHVGDVALEKAVLSYDRTTASLDRQMLLLNIGRRDAGLPIHFTQSGQIAASFAWDASLNARTQHLQPGFSLDNTTFELRASGRERPTFQIYPVSGSDFAYRFLTPITEQFVSFLAFQGSRVNQVLRLLGRGIEIQNPDGSFVRFVANDPRRRADYVEYRRILLHLEWLLSQQKLFVRGLVYEDPIVVREAAPQEFELTQAYGAGQKWRETGDGRWALTRRSAGRIVIMNVDPEALSHIELSDLQDRIEEDPPSFVHLEIRPEGPGGDFPVYGAVALRSMYQVLDFVGRSIERHPEFDVQPAAATGRVALNPVHTLHIVKGGGSDTAIESVGVAGNSYSVANTKWDKDSFRMLHAVFQASMGEIRAPGIPITIAK